MTNCIYCTRLVDDRECQSFLDVLLESQKKYPTGSLDFGSRRQQYITKLLGDCKEYSEAFR